MSVERGLDRRSRWQGRGSRASRSVPSRLAKHRAVPTLTLRLPDTGESCGVELDRGLTYALAARTPQRVEALLEQLLQSPGSHVADSVGGLVGDVSVLENIALPAAYHRYLSPEEIEQRALDAFGDCGVDRGDAVAMLYRRPADLNPFEKRLAGFVRCLLAGPRLLVYSRFFEGLTRTEMGRAAALNAVYCSRHPQATAVYLMLADMPDPQPQCHRRLEI